MDKNTTGKAIWFKVLEVVLPLAIYYVVYDASKILMALILQLNGKEAIWNTMAPVLNGISMTVCFIALLPMALKSGIFGDAKNPLYIKRNSIADYLVILLLALSAVITLNFILGITGITKASTSYSDTAERLYSVSVPMGILLYGVIAPLAEETLFRGLIYNRTKWLFGKTLPAILISAIAFAIYHGNLVQGIYGFLLGTLIAFCYYKFQSFAVPLLMHSGGNICIFLLNVYPKAQVIFSWISCIALAAIALLCLTYVMKHTDSDENRVPWKKRDERL